MRFLFLALGALFLAASSAQCQSDSSPTGPDPGDALPAPQTVSYETVPAETAADQEGGEAVYYLIEDDAATQERLQSGPDAVLNAVMDQGLALQAAWYPIEESIRVPCGAPEVYPALVVRLKAPASAIEEMGFVSDTGVANPNCGVEQFQFYDFE